MTKNGTAIVILAAGHSKRFEGCKVLAGVRGKPLLQWAIEKARACVGEHVYVVTGGWGDQVLQAMAAGSVDTVATIASGDWHKGLGHSIAAAVAELAPGYRSLLIVAADQIAITHSDLQRLMEQSDGAHIVAAHYDGQPGIPALFPEAFYADLASLHGDRGAKKILMSRPHSVQLVDCPNAAIDIDTRANLEAWLNSADQSFQI